MRAGRRAVDTVAPDEDVLRTPAGGGVLVFDGYCGFCTRSVYSVLRLDRRGRVRALPLQGRRVLALTGLTREQALRQAWWVGHDGARLGGAGAMAAAVGAATGLPTVRLYRLPRLRALADWVYRWVAGHRRLLRGVTPHCIASPEADCDADDGHSCSPAGRP
jgi:predicted DCC family thiol-disulfide oxidoreductase YuxK